MNRYLFCIVTLFLFVMTKGVSQTYHTVSINITQSPCTLTTVSPFNVQLLNFNLFPNPANDMVSIELLNYHDSYTITISDVLGNQIKTFKSTSKKPLVVTTTDMNTGLYFVSVISESYLNIKKIAIIH